MCVGYDYDASSGRCGILGPGMGQANVMPPWRVYPSSTTIIAGGGNVLLDPDAGNYICVAVAGRN
jgi:hypothetical protein